MKPLLGAVLALGLVTLLLSFAPGAAAQAPGDIQIVHVAPSGIVTGLQIYLTAEMTNATSATIAWRNDTMSADSIVPMTNLTERNGTAWVYAGYLPAQATPTQITYAINASNADGFHIESYFLSVEAPASGGLTSADQQAWMLTMAASLSMIVSTVAVLYWYTGRRLNREVN